MDITPDALAEEFSLTTAATRLDFLGRRDSGEATLNTVVDPAEDDWSSLVRRVGTNLDVFEALELLALGEVVARKAHGSQLTGMRAALREGASWEQIAAALDITPAEAWDAYHWAIEATELAEDAAASARDLAGSRPAR